MTDHRFHSASLPLHLLLIAALSLFSIGVLAACGDDDDSDGPQQLTFDFPLEIETRTVTDQTPLSGVPVRIDGEVVGFTDADGKFAATMRDDAGKEIELAVDEIEGYTIIDNDDELPKMEKLQVKPSIEGEYRGIPIRLSVDLHSTLFEYLTWIELECDDQLDDEHCGELPVLVDGEEKVRTNHDGFAHFSFEAIPGETVEVSIDTSEVDDITVEPASPTYQLELDREATIFHIAEEFTDPDARPAPRPRRRAPRPTPRPQPQPEPEEEEGDGVIPLF